MTPEPLTTRPNPVRISIEVVVLLGLATAAIGEAFVIHRLRSQGDEFQSQISESKNKEREAERKFYEAVETIRKLEGRELVREGDNIAKREFGDQLAEIEPGRRVIVLGYVCAVCAGALTSGVKERCERVPWVHQVRFQQLNPPDLLVRIGQNHATVLAFIEMDRERTKEDLIEATSDRVHTTLNSFVTLFDRTMTKSRRRVRRGDPDAALGI